jgi:hypothetical protein
MSHVDAGQKVHWAALLGGFRERGTRMALRFQEKDDVDQAAKEERETGGLLIMLVLYAAIDGAFTFFKGESLASYGKNLAWLVGIGFVLWMVAPFYYEFRFRTKEIDGKVSAIEDAVILSREDQAELLERLTAIEERLEAMQREQENRIKSAR